MINSYAREHLAADGAEQYRAGVEVANLLVKLFPKRAHGYNLLGAAASMRENWGEAKRQFEAAIKVAPTDSLVIGNLGILSGEARRQKRRHHPIQEGDRFG
jgi:Flp pilus assembly protein TadD